MQLFAAGFAHKHTQQTRGPERYGFVPGRHQFKSIPKIQLGLEPTRRRNSIRVEREATPTLRNFHLIVSHVRYAILRLLDGDGMAVQLLPALRRYVVFGVCDEVLQLVIDIHRGFEILVDYEGDFALLTATVLAVIDIVVT